MIVVWLCVCGQDFVSMCVCGVGEEEWWEFVEEGEGVSVYEKKSSGNRERNAISSVNSRLTDTPLSRTLAITDKI